MIKLTKQIDQYTYSFRLSVLRLTVNPSGDMLTGTCSLTAVALGSTIEIFKKVGAQGGEGSRANAQMTHLQKIYDLIHT